MKSTDRCRAKRRSSSSLSDSAGTLTATPGRDSPLSLETSPPSTTRQNTSVPLTDTTVSAILPSSTRSRSPRRTSLWRSLYVVDTRDAVPTTSSTVMQTWLPVSHRTGPSAKVPSRILGPWQVGQDRDGVTGAVRGLADQPVGGRVVGVGAVAEVQPGDVHARLDEGGDLLRGAGSGSEGADDLRAAGHDRNASGAPSRARPGARPRPGSRRGTAALGPEDRARSPPGTGGTPPYRKRDRRWAHGLGSIELPVSQTSAAAAAARPSAIAQTISDCPRPMSPATNTPGTVAMNSLSRTTLPGRRPRRRARRGGPRAGLR